MIPEDRAGIICIHSVYPGEGKSYNAVNIASVLAMNSKKVVLIGADVRKPRTNKIFNMDNSHGLSTYLIGHDNINEVIFETIIENLSVIPSGPVPPNPAEILGRKELKTLLDELSRRYDYVIIDNAPVGIVTDGFIIGKLADLNIFILRYGKSQKHQVEQINQYAAKKMVDHVALVVNDIKNNGFGYSYNKYSNYEHDQKKYYSIEDGGTKKVKRERTKN
jgi:capsular exopolysaccharide synthesis family protein